MLEKIGDALERHSGKVILGAVVMTLLLIIPLFVLESSEQASSDPAGEVFDLRDEINSRFPPRVHVVPFIVESATGDILTQAALWELFQNEQGLREDDAAGKLSPEGLASQPYLHEAFDSSGNRPFMGVYTIADAVQEALTGDPRIGITLETATDEHVKLALHQIFSNPATSDLRGSLSTYARHETRDIGGREIDYWVSPAMFFTVLADNDRLGGGSLEIGVGGGETVLDKEEFSRNVQQVLRGDEQSFRLWGVAIDVNLESADQGQTAGYFIMFTVIAAVLIAGLSLRSYWAVALTGAGLGSLMIWLNGISNLVGLKGGLVVDLIVPIAMISLGVDFALHSLRRYGEEKGRGHAPRRALRAAFAGVLGALMLAMASDSIAFLSNSSSEIETVVHFGIAAGIAVVSSFIVLGVVLPLAMLRIDELRDHAPAPASRRAGLLSLLNSLGVAALTGTGVILLVAVSKPLGVGVLLGMMAAFLGVPVLIMRRRKSRRTMTAVPAQPEASSRRASGGWFSGLAVGLARHRLAVLLVATGLTAGAAVFAVQLEATFDVKDFFDSNSDFVVGLDKVDEHVGATGGESGTTYIEGDLTDPGALAAIDQFILELADNPSIARRADGTPAVWPRTVVRLVRSVTENEYALGRVADVTGVQVADTDGDGLPESQEEIEAVYTYILAEGIPRDENALVYTPDEVREVLYLDLGNPQNGATVLRAQIPGTREQQVVIEARDSFDDSLETLNESPAIVRAGLTGSPFTRLAQLDATTKTLQKSLPIAAAATLLLLLLVMRSFRYAVMTIIPIGLVVTWLYGLMQLTGFGLNYVTATIGAVSLGVGIDYSIHMTERFREEMRKAPDKVQALRQAASGTGVALLASAASSIAGFAIMGLAPMPLFSSYGVLTALMILLAAAASLVVLPSLLLLVTPEKPPDET